MWIIIQFINISFVDQSTSNVAWFAHIGGFIFDFFIVFYLLKKRQSKRQILYYQKKKKSME